MGQISIGAHSRAGGPIIICPIYLVPTLAREAQYLSVPFIWCPLSRGRPNNYLSHLFGAHSRAGGPIIICPIDLVPTLAREAQYLSGPVRSGAQSRAGGPMIICPIYLAPSEVVPTLAREAQSLSVPFVWHRQKWCPLSRGRPNNYLSHLFGAHSRA